jgi:hypothetical protein
MAADIQEIKMPLDLEGFYFAFRVWLKAIRFKSNLNLNYAHFSREVRFAGSVFEEDFSAWGTNFGSYSGFQDCVFNKMVMFPLCKIWMGSFPFGKL